MLVKTFTLLIFLIRYAFLLSQTNYCNHDREMYLSEDMLKIDK